MYFQFLAFPSAIHSIALASRRWRVSSPFASAIHSTYSRRWLGLNASKVARAFAFFLSAAANSAGISGSGFGVFRLLGALIPSSFSFIACFT